ncbi:MAG: hypothetical protein L0H84_04285 [Pseudonocardia sp.]|nr:hypothetical protein [Pseudonocardia sp.]
MRRVLLGAASVYLLFAVAGRFLEGTGRLTCGCVPGCWCKKPGLRTFRWVFPAGHRFPRPG